MEDTAQQVTAEEAALLEPQAEETAANGEGAEEQEQPCQTTEEPTPTDGNGTETVESLETPVECKKEDEVDEAEEDEEEEEEEEEDEDARKLFVGGLSWETQQSTLKDFMTQYGEVKACTIKIDNTTGKSRGFGFVIFTKVAGLEKALESKPHKVDGREIDSRLATPQRREGNLFVGGVDPETTEEMIKEYFAQFGKIEKLERPFDKDKKTNKRFCFITFSKDGPIAKIIKKRYHDLGGKQVECKHAEPLVGTPGDRGGGRGGGRGGRGGRGGPGGFMGGNWNQGYGAGGNFPGGYGGFGPGFPGPGYGAGFGYPGGFGGGYGAGGFGGAFGGGYGGQGYGGGGFGGQQSGFGKTGRGRRGSNYKPY